MTRRTRDHLFYFSCEGTGGAGMLASNVPWGYVIIFESVLILVSSLISGTGESLLVMSMASKLESW